MLLQTGVDDRQQVSGEGLPNTNKHIRINLKIQNVSIVERIGRTGASLTLKLLDIAVVIIIDNWDGRVVGRPEVDGPAEQCAGR